jgi:hypothetical protein
LDENQTDILMAAHKGNKYAQIWNEENAMVEFIKALEFAEKDSRCLCLEDAIHHAKIPYSTYDYLANKYEVLGRIKKDTMAEVKRRINKGSLEGDYNPASGIWRMKQLGDTDKQEIKQEVTSNQLEVVVKRMDK